MALLNKKIGRIIQFNGEYGVLLDIEKNESRLYTLNYATDFRVYTDLGVLHVKTKPGFKFDGRSGPRIVDWYTPNLGNIYERLAWFLHDVLGYATCLDFASTNHFLKIWLKDIAEYSKCKSRIIELAVSLDDSWFGVPEIGDQWRCNLGKYEVTWTDN